MCGRRLRAVCLFSVALLLLCSATSWAEVCLSDEEFDELTGIFARLEMQSQTQGRELETVKKELAIALKQSNEAQRALNASEIALTRADFSLREAEKSLRRQRIAATLISIAAAAGGFLLGWLLM